MDAQFAGDMDGATDRLADVNAYADYFGHFTSPVHTLRILIQKQNQLSHYFLK
jgi:hypothetical protein